MRKRGFMRRRFIAQLMWACLGMLGTLPATAHAQGSPDLQLSKQRLAFYASRDGSTPTSALFSKIDILNRRTTALSWVLIPSDPWITFDQWQGSMVAGATSSVNIAVDISHAVVGPQTGTVTVYDAESTQPLATVTVFLRLCDATCVSVDVAATGRTISPMLFGSQIEWLHSGSFLWNRPASATCNNSSLAFGAPSAGMIDLLTPLGVRLLRYPGGITGDFFNWSESVGPVTTRAPQIDPFSSNYFALKKECPVFGPDELVSVGTQLGAELLTVANVGTGTAQGAANWLLYNRQHGIRARFWEIGNENYLPGTPKGDPAGSPFAFAGAYRSPAQYATAFNDYARALRTADADVQVGAILEPGTSSWNEPMLAQMTEPADFFTTHLLFPKWSCNLFTPDDQIYRTLMAAPILFTYQLQQLEESLARAGVGRNKNSEIAITEYGTFFWCFDYGRNRSLGAALFGAMNLNAFFRDPRVTMAMTSNLTAPNFFAPVGFTWFGIPIRTPFYDVFRAYAQVAGGVLTNTAVLAAPTFATNGLEGFPPLSAVPALDAVSVSGPEPATHRLFVVNRNLQSDVIAHVAFDSLTGPVSSVSMALVNGASYTSENSWFTPQAVMTTTAPLPAASEFDFTFPAHSLTVLVLRGGE
jgi:alpha-L-arabinofuranosidase